MKKKTNEHEKKVELKEEKKSNSLKRKKDEKLDNKERGHASLDRNKKKALEVKDPRSERKSMDFVGTFNDAPSPDSVPKLLSAPDVKKMRRRSAEGGGENAQSSKSHERRKTDVRGLYDDPSKPQGKELPKKSPRNSKEIKDSHHKRQRSEGAPQSLKLEVGRKSKKEEPPRTVASIPTKKSPTLEVPKTPSKSSDAQKKENQKEREIATKVNNIPKKVATVTHPEKSNAADKPAEPTRKPSSRNRLQLLRNRRARMASGLVAPNVNKVANPGAGGALKPAQGGAKPKEKKQASRLGRPVRAIGKAYNKLNPLKDLLGKGNEEGDPPTADEHQGIDKALMRQQFEEISKLQKKQEKESKDLAEKQKAQEDALNREEEQKVIAEQKRFDEIVAAEIRRQEHDLAVLVKKREEDERKLKKHQEKELDNLLEEILKYDKDQNKGQKKLAKTQEEHFKKDNKTVPVATQQKRKAAFVCRQFLDQATHDCKLLLEATRRKHELFLKHKKELNSLENTNRTRRQQFEFAKLALIESNDKQKLNALHRIQLSNLEAQFAKIKEALHQDFELAGRHQQARQTVDREQLQKRQESDKRIHFKIWKERRSLLEQENQVILRKLRQHNQFMEKSALDQLYAKMAADFEKELAQGDQDVQIKLQEDKLLQFQELKAVQARHEKLTKEKYQHRLVKAEAKHKSKLAKLEQSYALQVLQMEMQHELNKILMRYQHMKENHEAEITQAYELKAITLKQKIARTNLRTEHNRKVLAVEGPIDESSRDEFRNDLKKLESIAKDMNKKRDEERKKYEAEKINGVANLDKQCENELAYIKQDVEQRKKDLEDKHIDDLKELGVGNHDNKKRRRFKHSKPNKGTNK